MNMPRNISSQLRFPQTTRWSALVLLLGMAWLLTACQNSATEVFGLPITNDAFRIEDDLIDGEVTLDYSTGLSAADVILFYENQMAARDYRMTAKESNDEEGELRFTDEIVDVVVVIAATDDPRVRRINIDVTAAAGE